MSDDNHITLADRLEHGLLTLGEVAELASVSRRKVEEDAAAGRLAVTKIGRSTRVRGPNARAYLSGQQKPAHAA